MSNLPTIKSRNTLATLTLALLFSLGCASGPTPRQRAQRSLDDAAAAARAVPGAPREALRYAIAFLDALDAGLFAGRSPDPTLPARLDELGALLERAAAVVPAEAWRMWAAKGAVFIRTGREAEATTALLASMRTPNLPAAQILIEHADATGRIATIPPLCAAAAPYLQGDDRFALMKLCIRHQHVVSDEAGLGWATPDDRAFYLAERERRAQVAAREEDERRRRWEAERAYQRQRETDAELCIAQCKQGGHLCLSRCDGDRNCPQSCENYYQACLDECDARARAR